MGVESRAHVLVARRVSGVMLEGYLEVLAEHGLDHIPHVVGKPPAVRAEERSMKRIKVKTKVKAGPLIRFIDN